MPGCNAYVFALAASSKNSTMMTVKLLASIENVISALEDVLIASASAGGFGSTSMQVEQNGVGLSISYGYPSEIFATNQKCLDWIFHFPTSLSQMNVKNVSDDEMIRASIFCYAVNPYAFVDNFDPLIHTGAVDAKLKKYSGEIIPVQDAIETIKITVPPTEKFKDYRTEAYIASYEDHQVLDIHTFYNEVWNASVFIEFEKGTSKPYEGEIWIFIAFQRLPGPLPENHDWRFLVTNQNGRNNFVIDSKEMVNKTGLLYIGVGCAIPEELIDNRTKVVEYNTSNSASKFFEHQLKFMYTLRVLTKGCYFLKDTDHGFSNAGMRVRNYVGDSIIACETDHLTMFSGGITNPEIPDVFEYSYVENQQPRSAVVFVILATFTVFMAIVAFLAFHHDSLDISKGRIRYAVDNQLHEKYYYLVAVETGYRMFGTTDSNVFINLTGENGLELVRQLRGGEEMGPQFRWGTTDRFILTTTRPLGNLRKLRIWIDESGLAHRQSWFCDKVIIKDLHTGKIFEFGIHDWFGTQAGDGEVERLALVSKKTLLNTIKNALSFHSIADHLSYWNMFTGGGLLSRLRFDRLERALNVYLAMMLTMFCNILVTRLDVYTTVDVASYSVLGYCFSFRDVFYGFVFSLICLPTTILMPIVHRYIPVTHKARERSQKFCKGSKRDKRGRLQWYHRLANCIKFFECLIAIVFAFLTMHFGFYYYQEEVMAFSRRFLIMLLFWIVITEPLKAVLCSLIYTVASKNYSLIRDYELVEVDIRPVAEFDVLKAPELPDNIGDRMPSLHKINEIRERRMRDEQLFVTVREIVTFFVSVVICLGLAFFSRDTAAFYYQSQLNDLFVVNEKVRNDDIPFLSITKGSQFWTYMRTHFVDAMRVSWYDNNSAYGMRGFLNDKVSRSMGYGIIRQVRSVSNNNCGLAAQFAEYFATCEGYSAVKYEDRTPAYTVAWRAPTDPAKAQYEYIFRTEKELDGTTFYGDHDKYSPAGYALRLNGSASDLRAAFTRLEKENWIDDNTRAVFVEFSVYCAQSNHFAVMQFVVEIPPLGALFPKISIEVVRLIKYIGSNGTCVMAFEILYIIFCIVSFLKEIYVACTGGIMQYVKSFWKLVDLAILAAALFSLASYWMRMTAINEVTDEFTATNGNAYIRLDRHRNMELNFLSFMALVVFLTCIKMINILRFNRRIGVFASTLARSWSTMIVFGAVFLIINLAFDTSLYTLLVTHIESYRDFLTVTETTIVALLGKVSASTLVAASTLGLIVYVIFMLLGIVGLLNIFVMMVMYVFEEVRSDPRNQTNDYEVMNHLEAKTLIFFRRYKRHHLPNIGFPDTQHTSIACDKLEAKVELLTFRLAELYANITAFKQGDQFSPRKNDQ